MKLKLGVISTGFSPGVVFQLSNFSLNSVINYDVLLTLLGWLALSFFYLGVVNIRTVGHKKVITFRRSLLVFLLFEVASYLSIQIMSLIVLVSLVQI